MKIAKNGMNLNIPQPKICGVAFVISAEDKAKAAALPPLRGSPGGDDIDKPKDTEDVETDLDEDA